MACNFKFELYRTRSLYSRGEEKNHIDYPAEKTVVCCLTIFYHLALSILLFELVVSKVKEKMNFYLLLMFLRLIDAFIA